MTGAEPGARWSVGADHAAVDAAGDEGERADEDVRYADAQVGSGAAEQPSDPGQPAAEGPVPDGEDGPADAQATVEEAGPAGEEGSTEEVLAGWPAVPVTGVASVDAAAARLADLGQLPVDDHPATYDDVQRRLDAELSRPADAGPA